MKKIILTTAAVFALSFANAQDTKPGGSESIKFGIKAGYTNSNFGTDAKSDAISSFYAGVLVDFSLCKNFHVQPEVLYSAEGAKDAKLNFIRIPVMFKFYVTEGLNLQAGTEFACRTYGGDSGIKNATKPLDYGFGFGFGYELKSGLFLDARYNLGIADINDNGSSDKYTTNSLNVGLGFRF